MNSQVRHVFFDFDGVLCDSLEACVEEYERLRIGKYPTLPVASTESRMDLAFAGPLKTSLQMWLPDEESRRFFDLHSAAMRGRAGLLKPFPGVDELFRGLPAGSVSIVSSAYNDAIARTLRGNDGLPPAVKHLQGRDSGRTKTDKIKEVLALEGIRPAEAVYVGDLHSDLLYCQSVPLECILVTYGYHGRAHLEAHAGDAAALVDSISELHRLLLTLMER